MVERSLSMRKVRGSGVRRATIAPRNPVEPYIINL